MIDRAVSRRAPTGGIFRLHGETETRLRTLFLCKQAVAGGDTYRRDRRGDNTGGFKIFNTALSDGFVRIFQTSRRTRRGRLRPARLERRKDLRIRGRQIFRILGRHTGNPLSPGERILHGTCGEIRRACRSPVAIERHGDGQCPPPRIDILDDTAACETCCPAMLIVQIHHRLIRRRTLEHKVGQKSEFIAPGHFGPGFDSRDAHDRFIL